MKAGALAAPLLLACTETVEIDADESTLRPLPTAQFDPAGGVIPFPSNLLKNPDTRLLSLPASCGEQPDTAQAALRSALNQLDGFATLGAVLRLPFSEAVDVDTVRDRVFVVRLAERGAPLSIPEPPIALSLQPITRPVLAEDCSLNGERFELALIPTLPLQQASTYGVFLLAGAQTAEGAPLRPSVTWSLLRQPTPPAEITAGPDGAPVVVANQTPFDPQDPAELESLVGLARLWQAHAPLLSAFDALAPALNPSSPPDRSALLVASAFDTQTLTDAFDPSIEGSPASQLSSTSVLNLPAAVAGLGAPLSVAQFFAAALPGVPCSALGCDAIGSLHVGLAGSPSPTYPSPSFQSGDDCDPSTPQFGGAWSTPMLAERVCEQSIPLIVAVPATEAGPEGYPTVLFAHGLGRSKEDLLALAGTLAGAGFASVALDAVHHGARAVQISTDAALGCAGPGEGLPCTDALAPTCAPQCYAPMLSANLPETRDNIRQTVLDQLQLEQVLRNCASPNACGPLQVDPNRIAFVGQSLGALVGSVTLPLSSMRAGVLNVGGGDLLGILTDTDTVQIRCPLVDRLIAAGILQGQPWAGGANSDALCLHPDWKSQPGFIEFAQAARWLLAPADGLAYAQAYRASGKSALLAEVDGDAVIPNTATEALGMLWGLSPTPAALGALPPQPTAEALLPGGQWLIYAEQPADAGTGFPGNAYGHGSLLAPAQATATTSPGAGELGTALMRADTVGFLLSHL